MLAPCNQIHAKILVCSHHIIFTGIGRRLKELNPSIIIVGVDPHGSILAQPASLNEVGVGTYKVCIPPNYRQSFNHSTHRSFVFLIFHIHTQTIVNALSCYCLIPLSVLYIPQSHHATGGRYWVRLHPPGVGSLYCGSLD